jgi:hypothetical protein
MISVKSAKQLGIEAVGSINFAQSFDYTFNDGHWRVRWNVDAALPLAMRKRRRLITLANIAECLLHNAESADVNPEKLRRVNFDLPLIGVPAPNNDAQTIIIDGWSRMYMAIMYSIPELQIVILSREEEMALRLEDVILL